MGRPMGSRNRLVTLDYDSIGALVGIRGNTARRYAQRSQFNARSLESVMEWINRRRAAQGLSLIGVPDDVDEAEGHSDDDDPGPVSSTPTPPEMAGIFRYNPRRACFEEDDA